MRPLRVVQGATGNIGRRTLREVIRDPDLELAAVVVYDPRKEGVDAGLLCGEPPTGVLATTDHGAAISLDADCALYLPQRGDIDEVVAMLERGTNVVTTCGEFQAGGLPLGERRADVAATCRRGNSSLYATGSSPALTATGRAGRAGSRRPARRLGTTR